MAARSHGAFLEIKCGQVTDCSWAFDEKLLYYLLLNRVPPAQMTKYLESSKDSSLTNFLFKLYSNQS
jgi:hypothetical protein